MQTLRVTMLGGRGVGKTSLLAGMYSQVNQMRSTSDLRFDAELETSARLQKRLEDLQQWEKGLGAGPNTTSEEQSFRFRLSEKERRTSLRLEFVDYPGIWITDRPQDVMRILKQSNVVLVAIDTPALMEATGEWEHLHKIANKPHLIKDIFVELYRQVHHPRLVLFVPLRCERYVRNLAEAQQLLQKITKGYADAFDFLQCNPHSSKLAVVITPVQTLGSVAFSKLVFSENDVQKAPIPPDDYFFYFEKVASDAPYAPVDTDQPLRYILSFVLNELFKRKSRTGLFNVILGGPARLLSLDKHEDSGFRRVLDALDGQYKLKQAIRPFAEHCKETSPFQIVQGRPLFLKPL